MHLGETALGTPTTTDAMSCHGVTQMPQAASILTTRYRSACVPHRMRRLCVLSEGGVGAVVWKLVKYRLGTIFGGHTINALSIVRKEF